MVTGPSAQETPDERTVQEIWATVLGLGADEVRPEDNFFDLGGNSILAARVSARFAELYGVDAIDSFEIIFDAEDLTHTVALLGGATSG
jgi:acyl carrier protein